MNISCDIIKDLLPLYHDDVCSEDSKIAIEEHLKNCIECQRYFDSINEQVFQNDLDTNTEQVKAKSLRLLKKKIIKKNVIISIISIVCAAIVFLGGSFIIFHKDIPISYEDGLVDVEVSSDKVIDIITNEVSYGDVADIILNKDDHNCTYGMTKRVKRNGIEENVAYVYFTDSIWTKYISNKKPIKTYKFLAGSSIVVGYDEDGVPMAYREGISAVYYLVGDYTKLGQMSDEEFSKVAQDAVLLWEK